MNLATTLPLLLGLAWLLPLGSFAVIVLFGPRLGRRGVGAGYLATGAILAGFVLSVVATLGWLAEHPIVAAGHADAHAAEPIPPVSGEWYTLAAFGSLRITIGYYIDSLTLVHVLRWSRSWPRASTSTRSATCTRNCDDVTDRDGHAGRRPAARSAAAGSAGSSSTCRCSASACWDWSSPATSRWCSSSGNWSASARIC